MGRPASPQAKEYAGRASVFSLHKMCGVGQANPRCSGLMRARPKRVGPTRIVTPKSNRVIKKIIIVKLFFHEAKQRTSLLCTLKTLSLYSNSTKSSFVQFNLFFPLSPWLVFVA